MPSSFTSRILSWFRDDDNEAAASSVAAQPSEPAAAIDSLPLDLFVSDADESDIEPPRPAPPRVVETGRLCQWCAAPVDPTADTCPACGSNVQGDSEQSIPGLTELTETQVEELDRPLRLPRGADADAILGPNAGRIIIKLIDD